MRKLRSSALAIATATAVALGGMTAASAQDEALPNNESNVNLSSTGSSAGSAGDALELDEELNPRDIFGSDKSAFGEAPVWAQLMYGVGVAGVAASIFGLVIAPAANFIYANFLAK